MKQEKGHNSFFFMYIKYCEPQIEVDQMCQGIRNLSRYQISVFCLRMLFKNTTHKYFVNWLFNDAVCSETIQRWVIEWSIYVEQLVDWELAMES
jgi:hypothetical protein